MEGRGTIGSLSLNCQCRKATCGVELYVFLFCITTDGPRYLTGTMYSGSSPLVSV